jgi:hypothetical protein
MTRLRKIALITLVVLTGMTIASSANAVVPDIPDAMRDQMKSHDKTFYAPPSMSLDQRWLQIAALSAFETQSNDPGLVMDAFLDAGALVTYYLHAETTFYWTGTEWLYSYRTVNYYTDDNLTESVEQTWSGTEWENDGRTLATYDGSDRLSTSIFQIWDDGTMSFVNYFKFSYSYTGGGLISEVIVQNWNGTLGEWVNSSRGVPTYSGNQITVQLNQQWTGTMWVDQSRMVFTYSGDLVTEVLSQFWSGTDWQNTNRTVNTYSGNNLTQTIYQTWSGTEWVNQSRDDMTYSGSNEILSVGYNWVSNAWSYTDSDTSRYDGSNRLIENVTVSIQFSIETVVRNLYYYDGAGNLIESTYEFGFFGIWQMATKTVFTYSTSGIFDDDGLAGLPSAFSLAQNYPNPFNQSTLIPYSLAGDSHVKITVSNILGQTISTVVDEFQAGGVHTALWSGHDANGRSVASGIYFFRVQVGNASQVRKMVLLK